MRVEEYDSAMGTCGGVEGDMEWHAPCAPPFRLAGFPWFEQDGVYRRLPVKPRYHLPEAVDSLANCTAGGQIQFRTDSRKLSVSVELAGPADMNHMPQTGQCGFDCYVGPPKRQRYCSTTKFDLGATCYECVLCDFAQSEMRNVTLNFPLYQGVKKVWVGTDPDSEVLPPPPYDADGRVIVYGTSITQGGCAARPGMAYTNILSRRFSREFINLGFSGNGKGEPEVARTIADIANPACFVLDYEGNARAEGMLERTLDDFIGILREAYPRTPILVVSCLRFASESCGQGGTQVREEKRDFQRRTVEERRAGGDSNIHFCDGGTLLGDEFHECSVDGVHPTDLGFWLLARSLESVLSSILLG
jgi:hypothetical protein